MTVSGPPGRLRESDRNVPVKQHPQALGDTVRGARMAAEGTLGYAAEAVA